MHEAKSLSAQISDLFAVPDGHPDAHPPMPPVVARGRRPVVNACGYCRRTVSGAPRTPVSRLPASYFAQQIVAFRSGDREAAAPDRGPIVQMLEIAHALTAAEVQSSARYFSNLKRTPWIRVVETATVPKTQIKAWMLMPVKDGGVEPIGQRIIEVPENPETRQ